MPDTDIETERQVRRLEEQFKRLSITDSEGDLETGFVISRFPTEAIGACCLGSDCQLLSARDCGNVGGIYHGDQTPCDPSSCEVAPCPTATLVCDSISASKSKGDCGGFTSDCSDLVAAICHSADGIESTYVSSGCAGSPNPRIWLTHTKTLTGGCGPTGTGPCPNPPGGTVSDVSGSWTSVETVNAVDCTDSFSCTGELDGNFCSGGMDDSTYANCVATGGTSSPITGDCFGTPGSFCVTAEEHFSDEYTTALLISNTIAALPSYDGAYDDDCGASYNLSGDETSVTITRNKYKFLLSSPAPAGMVVDWDESGPDGVVHHTWTAAGGETETTVFTQNEPSTNGTTNTINIIVTCP